MIVSRSDISVFYYYCIAKEMQGNSSVDKNLKDF